MARNKRRHGWVKCNTDAAFYVDDHNGASGAVLRDPTGAFGGAHARWYGTSLSALAMEAHACHMIHETDA
uniref:RNase H type-1 domain-containing protein n=1 Tax=Setaria viridis TaxID=4556 RepID=A0A4U6TRJ5_SETVI|nr:hypothetical protein SEVIR_7G015900v2 [Setaria viridis]